MGISICGKNLKNTIVNGQDTDIECPTAKVKDKDVLLTTLLVQAVRNGCGSWFIDNSSNIKSSNNTSILCGLPLGIIEVCCILNQTIRTTQFKEECMWNELNLKL